MLSAAARRRNSRSCATVGPRRGRGGRPWVGPYALRAGSSGVKLNVESPLASGLGASASCCGWAAGVTGEAVGSCRSGDVAGRLPRPFLSSSSQSDDESLSLASRHIAPRRPGWALTADSATGAAGAAAVLRSAVPGVAGLHPAVILDAALLERASPETALLEAKLTPRGAWRVAVCASDVAVGGGRASRPVELGAPDSMLDRP